MIRRIQIGFVLLAIVLLTPLGLLISRTLAGLDRERELRHTTVASRVFDEAERQLNAFLREEDARPADHYRAVLSSGSVSPLARQPRRNFVLGYFQLDARGGIHSPREDASTRFMAELRSILPDPAEATEYDQAQPKFLSRKKAEAESLQQPGTTRVVQKIGVIGRAAPQPESVLELAEAKPGKRSLSSYSVLERLNRASKSRQEARGYDAFSDEQALAAEAPASLEVMDLDDRIAKRDRISRPTPAMAELPQQEESARRAKESRAAGEALSSNPPSLATSPLSPPRFQPLQLGPSPFSGAMVAAQRLILYRTTVLPDEGGPLRQGLLVDVPAFTAWLRAEVLGKSGLLESLQLEFRSMGTGWEGTEVPPDRFVYEHRFGEPFEALSARLLLAPLPDEGGSRYVYWVGLLLVVASTVGLFAVYRRVAVAVHFAERRSNFAAAVSHELKTPLTAIRMYAEMLRDGMVPEESRRQEYYATITSESERLTRLINNVLEFSNLENDRRELASVLTSIEPPLRDVVRVVEPHAAAQGFAVKLVIEPDLPEVVHDPDALQQILFNLIDNALKYARGARCREVEVSARATGDGIAIRVRDHGPGVDDAHLPHVFEAFYRGENELTRRTKGTGIGLALVRGLAEQMQATVSARNHPDGGLELELRLARKPGK